MWTHVFEENCLHFVGLLFPHWINGLISTNDIRWVIIFYSQSTKTLSSFIIKNILPGMGIFLTKIRWLWNCLIFIIGTPILVRHLYTEMAPSFNTVWCCYWSELLSKFSSWTPHILPMSVMYEISFVSLRSDFCSVVVITVQYVVTYCVCIQPMRYGVTV